MEIIIGYNFNDKNLNKKFENKLEYNVNNDEKIDVMNIYIEYIYKQ